MTSEATSRQKRSTPGAKPPDGDHRKKLRNRTTQSCMNCHTSKRMCDRKRPACSRCVQLGLIGLCIYEVDDPSQGAKPGQDESAHLIKRVAELESVVRELKNKPHPRWTQASGFEDLDAQHTGSVQDGRGHPALNISSPPMSSPPIPDYASKSHYGTSSARRSPSSPTSDFPGQIFPSRPFVTTGMTARAQSTPPDALSSAFLGYGDVNFLPPNLDSVQRNQPAQPAYSSVSHCGCLHEPTSYRTMLELSLGLRRASDVLGQSPGHRLGGFCPLHQRVVELDSYAMDSLSPPTAWHGNSSTPSPTAGSANQEPWHVTSLNAHSPTILDDVDPFMSWSPHRP